MIFPILITVVCVLAILIFYLMVVAPRLNPMNRAEGFVSQNLIDEAILEYKKILDRDPFNFVVHYKLAHIYFKMEEIDQAVVHLEEILKIDKYNFEVERAEVERKLGESYLQREEMEKAFQMFLNILNVYPGDLEALYHVAFISLGQEMFEVANKQFERLVSQGKKSFEVLFGAGMAAYQNQKNHDAIEHFREALSDKPYSDIGNIAIAFGLLKKRDYKTGINYLKIIIDNSSDENALFIAKRLIALLYVNMKKAEEGVEYLESLLQKARKNEMQDEIMLLLYDLGFTLICAERTDQAYDYWNELYTMDRKYKKIQRLTILLRKEMNEDDSQPTSDYEESVEDHIEDWVKEMFPENFIWMICGLRSAMKIDMSAITVPTRLAMQKDAMGTSEKGSLPVDVSSIIESFFDLDVETFRISSNRVVQKLKYKIDEILDTYRENDGVDFLATLMPDKIKTLVWVRRWKGVKVGEIPLRNFAQAVNDHKCKAGLFISGTELTPSGEHALTRLSKVKVVTPEELGKLLKGII